MRISKKASLVLVSTVLAAANASAAGLDFTPITSAVDVGTIGVALIAMGAVMMGPNVAKWASKKIATFFG